MIINHVSAACYFKTPYKATIYCIVRTQQQTDLKLLYLRNSGLTEKQKKRKQLAKC